MKNKLAHILFKIILLLLPLLISNEIFSQKLQPNRWFFKADGGISIFYGDVKRYDYIPEYDVSGEIQPMFGASFGRELSKIFNIRGQFLYGRLGGHKKSAHFNFRSTVMGGHLMTDINLFYLFTGARFGDLKMNLYTSLGVGYVTWDSKLHYDNPQPDGNDLIAESSNGSLSIPGSISVEYVFNRHFSVNLEGMLFVISSDEVDAKVGGISMDMFSYLNVGVVYKLSSRNKVKRTAIEYELDPSLYEAQPDDSKYIQEKVVVPVVVEKTEEAPKVIMATDEIVKPDDTDAFPINHELEKAAIQKEIWANRSEDPWPETKFSVQIKASKYPINIKELRKEYDIDALIIEKYDEEWYRYSVGEYDKVWKAKELRNKLRSVTGLKGAFIVVYRNDERISLEEALNYAARAQSKETSSEESPVEEQSLAEILYPMISLEDNIPSSGIVIGVQVLSIQNNEYPLGVFNGVYGIGNPIMVNSNSPPWYKLIVGGFSTYQQAYDFQFEARDKGFIDAFVVAFKDGKRISLKRLKEELNK